MAEGNFTGIWCLHMLLIYKLKVDGRVYCMLSGEANIMYCTKALLMSVHNIVYVEKLKKEII